ncbi:hypothetical protein ABPG74_000438 [Tetrahymena malaccensis]
MTNSSTSLDSSQDSIQKTLIDEQDSSNNQSKNLDPNRVYFELPEDIQEEGIIKEINSYRVQSVKLALSYILFFITCGILYLFSRWNISLKIRLQMTKCSPQEAQFMKVVSQDDQITLVNIETKSMKFEHKPPQNYLIFSYRLYTYYYDNLQNCFLPIQFALSLLTNNEIYQKHGFGISNESTCQELISIYGQNNTEIPDKSTLKIFFDEVLSPFYIFQIFSIILWILEPYYYYASIIFSTSALSCIVSLIETKNNYKKLREMSFFETEVFVYRGVSCFIKLNGGFMIDRAITNHKRKISSLDLVPGDIIEIPDGQILPCDVILLNGSSVMNESMLTGESIPIIKSALPFNNNKYHPNEDGKQSTLFAGTKCIEARQYKYIKFFFKLKQFIFQFRYHLKGSVPILGLVSSTSFNTMKGQLVRSILYPKQNSFSFYVDSLKFIAVLALISVLGFAFSLPFLIRGYHQDFIDLREVILNSLDLITITVPPALPTCLSIGISFAISRLRKKQIFCISPPKVNISGKVTIMCFDKTGTLTEEGLDMYGLRPVFYQGQNQIKFAKLEEETYRLGFNKDLKQNSNPEKEMLYGEGNPYSLVGDPEVILKECMASCHGITRIKGELIGDPLEVKMFEATEWELIESNLSDYQENVLAVVKSTKKDCFGDFNIEKTFYPNIQAQTLLGIVKRFEFSSKLQRMSTIVKNLDFDSDLYKLYVKGSPEKIFELSNPYSIPQNFHEVLDFYARKGFRVLAFGIKVLQMKQNQVQKLERDEVEKDLTFAGLLIMENKLKLITTSIIDELQQANIRTIMVTGDNALTAISVGRQCKIIDESKRVYFGDLSDDPTQKDRIIWKDFENGKKYLNEDDLEPANGVAEYQENQLSEIEEEQLIIQQASYLENKDKRVSMMNQKGGHKGKYQSRNVSQIVQSSKIYRERAKTQMSQQNTSQIYTQGAFDQDNKNLKKNDRTDSVCSSYSDDQEESIQYNEQQKIAALNDDIQDLLPWNNHQESYSLAITGRAFSKIISQASQSEEKEHLLRTMLLKTQIFARMRPEEKAHLLQMLQDLPWKPTCGMCGDGANDCGALKTADIGISLSEAEASIAAPFTSKVQDISCVIELLKEGRAALVTSFSCFKFMALYSMIQFFTTTILYTVNSVPGDMQFLYWDLVIIIPLAFLMGLTDAYPKLAKQVPGSSLVSFPVLCSVIGMTLLNGGFQVNYLYFFQIKNDNNFKQIIMFVVLRAQNWYMSVYDSHSYLGDLDDSDSRKSCYESTVLFLFSNFQYISTCIAFSIGKPFKKGFYTNIWFTICLVLITLLSLYILLLHDSFTTSFLDIFEQVQLGDQLPVSEMPKPFLVVILGIACASSLVNILYEKYVVAKLALIFKNKKDQKRNQTLLEPFSKIKF